MTILIIQENGRHEKNRHFRECFSLQKAFISLGVSCDVWGLGHGNYNVIPNFDDYTAIINLENYDETGWLPDLSKIKTKKYLWAIDAHVRGMFPYLSEFKRGNYDKILQSTLQLVDSNSVWFPNAYDDTLIAPLKIEKVFDVGFCGNVHNRGGLINLLSSKFNMKTDIFVIGHDMVKAVNSYKVHFNCNIGIDVNYRSFETIGCGTVLLTNRNKAYEHLGFVHDKNCLIYDNDQDLINHVYNILTNENKRKYLELEGLKLAKNHTYNARAILFLEQILKK